MAREHTHRTPRLPLPRGWPDVVLGLFALVGIVCGLEWLGLEVTSVPRGAPVEVRAVVTDFDSTRWSRTQRWRSPMRSFGLAVRTDGGERLTFAFPRYRYAGDWPSAVRPGDTLRLRFRHVPGEEDYPATAIDAAWRGDEALLRPDHGTGLRHVLNRDRLDKLWTWMLLGALALSILSSRWGPFAREVQTRAVPPRTAARGVG